MSRYLYIAPRFHTNQVPVVRGLIRKGHEVKFISQYAGNVEDYSDIEPLILGYSRLFDLFYSIIIRTGLGKDNRAFIFRLKAGWPSGKKLKKEIKSFNPDVVISRERSIYTMAAASICRKLQIPIILYDQSPLWMNEVKNDLAHRWVRAHTPERRMTPVLGREGEGHIKDDKALFIPFVMEAKMSPAEREQRKTINILEVGKYEPRKNHLLMIEVFAQLAPQYDVFLTIVGECSSKEHNDYYEKVKERIGEIADRDPDAAGRIKLLTNLKPADMDGEYRRADIFVLPSTREPASISQLEAMAYSLPVICSDQNGTASYVENGINGYQFKDGDKEDLRQRLENIAADSRLRASMGEAGYRLINEKYQIENYIERVERLLEL